MSDIQFECHATVGTRFYHKTHGRRVNRDGDGDHSQMIWINSAIYHLYRALLISDGRSRWLWQLWIDLLRRFVRDVDPLLYLKSLLLYERRLREEQSPENTETILSVSSQVDALNSKVELVSRQEASQLELSDLPERHTLLRDLCNTIPRVNIQDYRRAPNFQLKSNL